MHKFSVKSIIYLPLMALALGVIPVLLMPPGQMLLSLHYDVPLIRSIANAMFPFSYDAYALIWIQFALLLPLVWMLWALVSGKKAYHGLYALFVVIGFMLKAQALDGLSYALLAIMGVMAALNIMAYLYATGDNFDDWLNYYFSKAKMKQVAGNAQSSGLGDTIMYPARRATRTFSDVVGLAELKAKLVKAGKEIVSDPKARNGILLTGEPGNGKTSMAEALAGELKLPIIDVAFGNFVSMWVGETTQKVMKVFDDAEKQAPCMLFIDEIEAVLVDRSKTQGSDQEASKTVAALLKRLENIRRKKVVVVAATNFLEKLDPASIREGRFDYKIEILPPDFEARKFLLQASLKSVSGLVDIAGLERAAKRWECFSVSRIRSIATEVLEQLKDKKIGTIGFDELAQALRNLNATLGDRIPENALGIEDLILTPEMRSKLSKLAARMVNIDKIEEMGGSVPAGVLFYGPAGTGKTIAAMALAKASKWAFLKTSGHDLLHNPKKMEDLMRLAKDIRPCIIFIDEADDVLADRRSSMISKDVTNKLLTIMDGAGGKTKDILFIAATNAPDLIDKAMLRGGRFTEKVAFDVPDDEALHEYVSKWIARTKAHLDSDFTPSAAVSVLSGQSLANVGEILQSAINEAISTGDNEDFKVTLTNLETARLIVHGV